MGGRGGLAEGNSAIYGWAQKVGMCLNKTRSFTKSLKGSFVRLQSQIQHGSSAFGPGQPKVWKYSISPNIECIHPRHGHSAEQSQVSACSARLEPAGKILPFQSYTPNGRQQRIGITFIRD